MFRGHMEIVFCRSPFESKPPASKHQTEDDLQVETFDRNQDLIRGTNKTKIWGIIWLDQNRIETFFPCGIRRPAGSEWKPCHVKIQPAGRGDVWCGNQSGLTQGTCRGGWGGYTHIHTHL